MESAQDEKLAGGKLPIFFYKQDIIETVKDNLVHLANNPTNFPSSLLLLVTPVQENLRNFLNTYMIHMNYIEQYIKTTQVIDNFIQI